MGYLPLEQYVKKETSIRMSNKKMADFLYACIMLRVEIKGHITIGCEQYDRKQNSYNGVHILINIHPSRIFEFIEMTGCELREAMQVHIN